MKTSKMSKVISGAMAIVMVFSMAACGKAAETKETDASIIVESSSAVDNSAVESNVEYTVSTDENGNEVVVDENGTLIPDVTADEVKSGTITGSDTNPYIPHETVNDSPAENNDNVITAEQPAENDNNNPAPDPAPAPTPEPSVTTPSEHTTQVVTPTPEMLTYIRDKFLSLVNAERASVGLPAYTTQPKLNEAADIRAWELIKRYSHTRPDDTMFGTIFSQVQYGNMIESITSRDGINWVTEWISDTGGSGENIGRVAHIMNYNSNHMPDFNGTQEELDRVAQLHFDQFKASAPHYAQIIDKTYKNTGAGISYAIFTEANGDNYVVFSCSNLFTEK